MVDQAKLWIRSGKGGDGSVSFRREKFIPKGGPDGGNGGKGGDIYMETDTNQNTLDDFAHREKFEAQNGGPGRGKKMSGAKGEDLVIKVPLGTVVTLQVGQTQGSAPTGENPPWSPFDKGERELQGDFLKLIDFDRKGMRVLVAKGGAGGRGNEHFKSASNTTPMTAEPGQAAQSFQVELSLKLLADVGLIGLPNAGKSTLLSVLSNARPKVADYEFTTLEPNLGVLRLRSGRPAGRAGASPAPTGQDRSLVIADIPGLIEGASEGKGLGTKFLKHIERTKVLVHLVAAPTGKNPPRSPFDKGEWVWKNYQKIRNELKNYGGDIDKKREIVVLSKVDLMEGKTQKIKESKIQEIVNFFGKKKIKILPISSATQKGIAELVAKMQDIG
jgi:GTP-binding protein